MEPLQRTPAVSGKFLNGRSVLLETVPLMSGYVMKAEKSIIFRFYLLFLKHTFKCVVKCYLQNTLSSNKHQNGGTWRRSLLVTSK